MTSGSSSIADPAYTRRFDGLLTTPSGGGFSALAAGLLPDRELSLDAVERLHKLLVPEMLASAPDVTTRRRRICEEIRGLAVYTREELEPYLPPAALPPAGQSLHCFASPEDIRLVVAGGGGLYSMVMPSWCAGPHRNTAVSVAVRLGESCVVPGLAPPG